MTDTTVAGQQTPAGPAPSLTRQQADELGLTQLFDGVLDAGELVLRQLSLPGMVLNVMEEPEGGATIFERAMPLVFGRPGTFAQDQRQRQQQTTQAAQPLPQLTAPTRGAAGQQQGQQQAIQQQLLGMAQQLLGSQVPNAGGFAAPQIGAPQAVRGPQFQPPRPVDTAELVQLQQESRLRDVNTTPNIPGIFSSEANRFQTDAQFAGLLSGIQQAGGAQGRIGDLILGAGTGLLRSRAALSQQLGEQAVAREAARAENARILADQTRQTLQFRQNQRNEASRVLNAQEERRVLTDAANADRLQETRIANMNAETQARSAALSAAAQRINAQSRMATAAASVLGAVSNLQQNQLQNELLGARAATLNAALAPRAQASALIGSENGRELLSRAFNDPSVFIQTLQEATTLSGGELGPTTVQDAILRAAGENNKNVKNGVAFNFLLDQITRIGQSPRPALQQRSQ